MSMTTHEVIDVDDDPDVFCTGVRHCIRIDRPPSPPHIRKRHRPAHDDSPPLPPPCIDTELQRITQLELQSRLALHDSRTNRRAADVLKMATTIVENIRHLKRKAVQEVIEISSDSEPEIFSPKRQKVEQHSEPSPSLCPNAGVVPKHEADCFPTQLPSPGPSDHGPPSDDDDDDDDCINFLASLDISHEANWTPLPEGKKAEDLTPMHESENVPPNSRPLPLARPPRRKPLVDHHHVPLDWSSMGTWGTLTRTCGVSRFPKPFYHARRQDCLFTRRAPNLYYESGYSKLELTAKYPHLASGAVNRVIQAEDTVVLCAVVVGGVEDDDDDDDEDEHQSLLANKLGSLVVYRHGRVHVPPVHYRPCITSRGPMTKYYTINDVAFNPSNPRQFLSSGHDLIVQAWEILDDYDGEEREGLTSIRQIELDSRPQDLVYNADGSALVISCFDGTVRLYSQDLFEDMIDAHSLPKKFHAAPRGSDHATGSTLWGVGPSKHLLFTSSEPRIRDDHSGFHHAFDTHRGTQLVQYDATEAGDAAAVSPDGTTLVLFTHGGHGNTHPVRLYDVRRKAKEAYETEELEEFNLQPIVGSKHDDSEEVNQASFSPDGRLLAVARSDNALHVYDVRALSRGPLCQFEHHNSDSVGGGGYGVMAPNWIQCRERIGIVSGGNDGCVRLWEPALGRDEMQGAVIGRTDFDVSHLSVGDRQYGELPLVVGDGGGGIHIYDFTNPDGDRIF